MVPSSSPTNDGMKIWMAVEVFVMFYRRIVHGLKSPTPVVLACSWTCQGSRPLLFLPRILDATTTLRRGRTDGGLSPPASLGHAGTCWCDFSSGEHTLGGSLGQSCKLARSGVSAVSARFGPQDTQKQKHAVNSGEMRDGALQRRRSGGELRFSSRPPIPAHIDADSPAPGELAADPRPPASRLQFG